jgi:EF-P beta-lysylation protein EpmB
MKNRVVSGARLLARFPESEASESASTEAFPARATERFLDAIQPGDAQDPLLLQILPRAEELLESPGFSANPVEDEEHERAPGLIHKYRNRVLLLSSGACPIHCRYCFRKSFPYPRSTSSDALRAGWVAYVASRPEIDEVIFSGGDPLFGDLRALADTCRQLVAIPHVRALRFHTRVPVVYPELVTSDFLEALSALGKRLCCVVHINHVRELNDESERLLERMRMQRWLLFSQSVLLRGVNDSATTLAALFQRLVDLGVVPYYLNLLDRVTGAAHFEVDEARAIEIYRELLASCSGYTVPKLVRDSGGTHKHLAH